MCNNRAFNKLFFNEVWLKSSLLFVAYLLHFKCEFDKNLLQLFIDIVDGKLFKLVMLKQKEKKQCTCIEIHIPG